MNNTKTLTAIVAILIAATLVVGGTLASSTTTAFAYQQKKGGSQENSKNGNTVTIQKCKQRGSVSGFDNTAEQECENLICTHPGNNATCTQEGVISTPTSTSTPTPQPTGTLLLKKICTNCEDIVFSIEITGNSPQISIFSLAPGESQLVTLGAGSYTVTEIQGLGIVTSFAGDYGTEANIKGTATGTISAGEHQTWTITNTVT